MQKLHRAGFKSGGRGGARAGEGGDAREKGGSLHSLLRWEQEGSKASVQQWAVGRQLLWQKRERDRCVGSEGATPLPGGWGGGCGQGRTVRGRRDGVLRGLERAQRTAQSDHRMRENKSEEGSRAGLQGRGESTCSPCCLTYREPGEPGDDILGGPRPRGQVWGQVQRPRLAGVLQVQAFC